MGKCVGIGIFFLVAILWTGAWWLPDNLFEASSQAGQFGDKFGAVNALFSGLAFAGLIVTLLLQRADLNLQRDELKQMRKQYERSAQAQEGSEKLLKKQADISLLTAKMEGFSALLNLHAARGNVRTTISLQDPSKLRSIDSVVDNIEECLARANETEPSANEDVVAD